MRTSPPRRLAPRAAWGALLAAGAVAPACHHDWDKYDPLRGSASSGTGGASSTTATATTAASTTTASSGGGAACSSSAPVADCAVLCDGKVSDHCGVWSESFSGANIQQGYALAVTPDAGVLAVVGLDDGDARFPDLQLSMAFSHKTFVVSLQPTATGAMLLWGVDFGNYQETAWSVAVDAASDVIVAGDFRYDIDPCPNNATPLKNPAGDGDMFVVKYDPQGKCRFARSFGEPGGLEGANAVAVDATGIYVGGYFHGTVDFGDGAPVTAGSATAAVLMKLVDDGNGSTTTPWKVTWDNTNGDEVTSLAVDPAAPGSVVAGGFYTYPITLGGEKRVANYGFKSGIVAKVATGNGAVTWSRGFTAVLNNPPKQTPPAGYTSVTSVAIEASSGDVVVAGTFNGSVDFSGVTAAAIADAGAPDPGCVLHSLGLDSDIFVVRLRGDTGACVWARSFGRNSSSTPSPRIATHTAGCVAGAGVACVIVGTTATESLDVGAWPPLVAQGDDALVFTLDATGAPVWARLFGDADQQELGALAVDASGAIYVTGSFQGTIAFSPSQALQVTTDKMSPDAFVARIAAP